MNFRAQNLDFDSKNDKFGKTQLWLVWVKCLLILVHYLWIYLYSVSIHSRLHFHWTKLFQTEVWKGDKVSVTSPSPPSWQFPSKLLPCSQVKLDRSELMYFWVFLDLPGKEHKECEAFFQNTIMLSTFFLFIDNIC